MQARPRHPDRLNQALSTTALLTALFLALAFPALRPIGVLCPGWLQLAYVLAIAIGIALLPRAHRGFLDHTGTITQAGLSLLLIAFVLFCAQFYPWASSLVEGNSTGDDAIIEPFRALLAGDPMYSARLFDGVPVSPGPLWILVNGWLSAIGLHFVLTPLYLLPALWLLPCGQRLPFALLLLASPLVWSTAGTGHDHVAIGLGFLTAYLAAPLLARSRTGFVLLVVMVAALASSRIIYLPWPVLLAVSVPGLRRSQRWWLAIAAMVIATTAMLASWHQAGSFPPAHLLQRGLGVTPPWLIVAGALVTALLAWHLLRRRRGDGLGLAVYAAALVLAHFAIATAELLAVHGEIARWEGANYVLPALPTLIVASLMALADKRDAISKPH